MRTNKKIKITRKSRRGVRNQLILKFLEEKPGTGKGELCSVYIYYVEVLKNGKRIFLKRPAPLNKGFDFEVHVEETNFGKKRWNTRPSHKNIIHDLRKKRKENPINFLKVAKIIDKIYMHSVVKKIDIKKLNFKKGHDIEIILKVIKWLFIEQDMTYWNWSGRNMFYSYINKLWK